MLAVLLLLGGIIARTLLVRICRRSINRNGSLWAYAGLGVANYIAAILVVEAIYFGLIAIPNLREMSPWIEEVNLGVVVILGTFATRAAMVMVIQGMQPRYSDPTQSLSIMKHLPFIGRVLTFGIFIIGGLLFLRAVGLDVTPLIASVGVLALAVALALQPLLQNVFASSYMLADSSLKVGEIVEIQNGPTGVVDDIGWRATRIRTFDNNIVMIPNSRLADSVVTNFHAADSAMDARVEVGVAYESDLEQVEMLCRQLMLELRDTFDGALKDHVPLFLYTQFDDSNINVLLKMRATDIGNAYSLRHLLIKKIHALFAREGITISYPSRRLIADPAETTIRIAGDRQQK